MNGNSSKQVLLSVLGIAILVVAVVGVSFAFFSYTKQGLKSNVIQTGQIYTYLTETDTVALTNAMPLKSTPAQKTSNVATDDVAVLAFAVTGKNESTTTIGYAVYMSEGAAPSGKTATNDRLYNEDINMKLYSSGNTTGTITPAGNIAGTDGVNVATFLGEEGTKNTTVIPQTKIAQGTFPENADETHQYYLNMWINNNATISDTDATVNSVPTKYCAKAKEGNPATSTASGNNGCEQAGLRVFSGAYYSVKINVVANTTTGNITDYTEPTPTP